MLQGYSPSWDFDYDSEPLLFDDEFCQNLLKDLEMLPTPPQSPGRKSTCSGSVQSSFPCSIEELTLVSELILDDDDNFMTKDMLWEHGPSTDKQESVVADDCMWGSLPSLDELEKVMNEKLFSLMSSSPLVSDIETHFFEDFASAVDNNDLMELPQTEERGSTEQSSSEDEESQSNGSVTQSSSDSEEEIDVVTVEKRNPVLPNHCLDSPPRSETRSQKLTHLKRCQMVQRSESLQRSEAQLQTLADLKRCHLEIQQQHNYAAPCPSFMKFEQPSHKRFKPENSGLFKQPTIHKSFKLQNSGPFKPSTANKSKIISANSPLDVEEEERRRTHNVLERQRRNELKRCFSRLREEVPELSSNNKASKVVILKRAREYVRALQTEEQKRILEKEKLRKKQERLKCKLDNLKTH
ncbi:myelocytomatosis oncogene homolog [Latimeria chalumnae]|uniref:myelocytomatosis oncogene homolog n=1 Tax=Latimeria chalumnae TaxID=7897 RepID=UPI0003C14D57|nr:PREDICTED: transcriptional regulator Myc-2-like [Latimeria chalumnae]|eukprot:XP_005986795.1 PREDICTED: transcriptional regulator Myc-2-like [Latimeria chalumnae]